MSDVAISAGVNSGYTDPTLIKPILSIFFDALVPIDYKAARITMIDAA